jgi:hypothetical protein
LAETIGEVDEFLGCRPDALSIVARILVSDVEAFWSSFVPHVGGGWMAEVVLEQLAVGDEVSVVGNSLSWSPGAVVSVVVGPVFALGFIRSNTAEDSCDVLSDVEWSTEGLFWHHVSSIVEGTCEWAFES